MHIFPPQRFAIIEQFRCITVSIDNHRYFYSFFTRMCPMRQYMNHRLIAPQTLIQIIMIFLKTGKVIGSSGPTPRFSQIIESCPDKLSYKKVIVTSLFPLLPYRYTAGLIVITRSITSIYTIEYLFGRKTRKREYSGSIMLVQHLIFIPRFTSSNRAVHPTSLPSMRDLGSHSQFKRLLFMEIRYIAIAFTIGIKSRNIDIKVCTIGLRCRTSRIHIMENLIHLILQIHMPIISPNLISQTPHHHARAISVAFYKIGKIFFPPIKKVIAVIIRHFVTTIPMEPAVPRFVYHHKTKCVAHGIKLGSIGIMRCTYGVTPHFFQLY